MLNDPVLHGDWHVVARSSEIVPGGVKPARLLGRDIVLWREGGQVHAWLDLCRHRGAKLSLGRVLDGCLVCPYHGWRYDRSGACTLVPAHPELEPPSNARAEVYAVEEHFGLVWVCLGTPLRGVPDFPEWADSSYRKISAGPYLFRAYAPRVMENFLDIGHYPFVHARFFGNSSHFEVGDYEVETSEAGLIARDIGVSRVWKAGPDGAGETVNVNYTYRVHRPLTGSYTKAYGPERFSMMDTVTPVDEGESLVWSLMALNYTTQTTDLEFLDYQNKVTGEDIPIVESQRPRLLALNLGAETHVPSDRMSVEYRRWLVRLGLKFGTS
jgi:phenylpropionate dioxygenase-like ring-hydroxylating dioxygenase large terminal subunit